MSLQFTIEFDGHFDENFNEMVFAGCICVFDSHRKIR